MLVIIKIVPSHLVNLLKKDDESAPKTDSEEPPNIDPKSSLLDGWNRIDKTSRIDTIP